MGFQHEIETKFKLSNNPDFYKHHRSTRLKLLKNAGKLRGKCHLKPRGKPRGPPRLNAVINRNVINAVYLSRYKRRNFFVKIFNKKLIQINKKI